MENWYLFEIGLQKEQNLTVGQIFRTRWCDELYAKISAILFTEDVNRAILYCSSKEQAKKLQKQLASAGHFNSCVSVDTAIDNLAEFQNGDINFLLVIDIPPFWEVTQGTNAIILRKFSVPHRVHEILSSDHTALWDFGNNSEVLDKDEATPKTVSNGGENLPFKEGDFGGWVQPINTLCVQKWSLQDAVSRLCQIQGWKFSVK